MAVNQPPELWEPQDASAWLEVDPLARADARQDREQLLRLTQQALDDFRRLPPQWRRQSWREREIFGALWAERTIVPQVLAGDARIGVGRRVVAGRRVLAGIISTETLLPPDPEEARAAYSISSVLTVPSRVPGLASEQVTVPVVLEHSPSPVRLGQVVPPNWILASSGQASLEVAPLQSGDEIAGEDRWGARSPGTLAAVVSRETDNKPLLLSVAHVLGEKSRKVVARRGGSRYVGRVVDSDYALDAAIAEPSAPWHFDYRVRAGDTVPRSPIPPLSDMPVRMWGAVSKYQEGRIDKPYQAPVGAGAISMLVPFSAIITSAPGDSGALMVAGTGPISGLGPVGAANMRLDGSMLGMVLAGPNPKLQTAQPETWAVPLTEVIERFRLQVWVSA